MSDYDWSADDLDRLRRVAVTLKLQGKGGMHKLVAALISGQYPPGPPCSPDVGQDMIRIVERWVQLDRDPLLTKP
jgi:hypothetical protein